MPAVSLSCRVCATEHPLVANGSCSQCFGPLDPTYDWDLLRGRVSRASIEAGPQSIWRYADLLPVTRSGGRPARSGHDAARAGSPPRRGARDRRALAQARHRESDPLVQGSRRRRGGPEGAGARARHALLLVDRQSRRRRCSTRSRRGPRRCGLRARATSSRRSLRPPRSTAHGSTRSTAPTTTARGSRWSCPSSCRGASSTSICARTTPRGRRRSPTRSRSSSAGRRRTPSRSRSHRARSSTRSARASPSCSGSA